MDIMSQVQNGLQHKPPKLKKKKKDNLKNF
jgi:hypothetical protein